MRHPLIPSSLHSMPLQQVEYPACGESQAGRDPTSLPWQSWEQGHNQFVLENNDTIDLVIFKPLQILINDMVQLKTSKFEIRTAVHPSKDIIRNCLANTLEACMNPDKTTAHIL